MPTIKRTIKTTKKSTSSHSSKVAGKSKKVSTKKVKPFMEKARYEEATITEVYSVGQSMLKTFVNAEKKSVSSQVSLTLLTVDLIKQGLKNSVKHNKDTLRELLYAYTGYEGSMNVPSFAMAIKRIIEKSLLLTNKNYKGLKLDENTNQVLKNGKVFSTKKIDEEMKKQGVNTKKRNTKGKNQTQTYAPVIEAIETIIANPKMLKFVENELLAKAQLHIGTAIAKQSIEAGEKPNDFKVIGTANLDKDAFGENQLNQSSN